MLSSNVRIACQSCAQQCCSSAWTRLLSRERAPRIEHGNQSNQVISRALAPQIKQGFISMSNSTSWMHPPPGPDVAGPQQKRQCRSKAAHTDQSTKDSESMAPDLSWMRPEAGANIDTGQVAWMQPPAGDGIDLQLGDSQIAAAAAGAGQQARKIHLDMATIMMASTVVAGPSCKSLTDVANTSVPNAYARNGMDIHRINKVIDAGCTCRTQCRATFQANKVAVHEFCKAWYSLSSDAQGRLLQVCYDSAGGSSSLQSTTTVSESMSHIDKKVRTELHFLDNHVTTDCLVAMLGTSSRTLFKNCNGFADGRRSPAAKMPRTKPDSAALIVDQFFQEVYLEAAEDLPETLQLGDVDAAIEGGHRDEGSGSARGVFAESGILPEWTPNQCAADVFAQTVGKHNSLRPRHVQHCHLRDMWWRFTAWCSALPKVVEAGSSLEDSSLTAKFQTPSWSSFWRQWDSRWKRLIRFRKQTQHAQCGICFRCTSFLQRTNATIEEKRKVAHEWRLHLMCQYKDRLIYWHLRFTSRNLREALILTIIIDSMDKTKSSWPQWPFRLPKQLDNFRRPKLVVTASLAHGFCGCIFVSHDEQTPHGASGFCEVLSRTLDKVSEICAQRRWRFPTQLVVQVDNTTGQAKNSETLVFLSTLVGTGHFVSAVENVLLVGHTHEDVDLLFGCIYSKVLRRFHFAVPSELVLQLQLALSSQFQSKGELLYVEMLTHVYDFGSWLSPLGVSLSGAFNPRQGVDVPHSFILKRRCELSTSEQLQLSTSAAVRGLSADEARPHAHDVLCLTKQFMHSETTCAPLLVLPHVRVRALARHGPTVQKMKAPLSNDRVKHLYDSKFL